MIHFYDTCSLLSLQQKAFESKFIISNITLIELESIKTSGSKDEDTKYAARKLLHLLQQNKDLYTVKIYNSFDDTWINNNHLILNNDSRIIATAKGIQDAGTDILFITSDMSCEAIARSIGLKTKFETIEDNDHYTGYKEIKMSDEELANFYGNILTSNNNPYKLLNNEYLLIKDKYNKIIDKYKWNENKYIKIPFVKAESKMFGKVIPKDVYQQIALDSLNNNQITMLRGAAGTGKAQPNSTLIPTKNGYIKLGNIKIGDKILDRFGNETTVLDVFPQGLKENYKITFSDGRIAYCNNEHIWSCYTSKGNLKNFTVQQMIDNGLQTNNGEWRYKIPITSPIEYQEKHYDIDPYVIGVFLGDGCCKENPLTLSSNDKEIVDEIVKLINAKEAIKSSDKNYNWYFRLKEEDQYKNNGNNKITRFQTKDFFSKYSKELICSASEKRIPKEYKYGSIKQRFDLLQGLLDTDGTIDNKQKGRVRFTSINLKLILDIQEICWSLGMSANIGEDNRPNKYTTGICYTLHISCEKKYKPFLFRLKRKKDIAIAYANNGINSIHSNKLTIKKIEKMPKLEEMTCILVDNEEHLYLTEQYIVTHNTLLALSQLFAMLERGQIDRIIIFCNTVATKGSAKLGFYPGSRTEKLLDSQIGNLLSSKLGDRVAVERLIDDGQLILIPFSDLRGYDTTGLNAGIFISEAQNLDIELMRLALQRIGDDGYCILDGDDRTQVDMSMYAGSRNGMKRVSKVFRGADFYGEVELANIHRSKIAKLAQKL